MKKWTVLMVAILFTLAVLAGCSGKKANEDNKVPDPPASLYPLTVTDAMGRQVTLEKKPEKIVSLMPSLTEILFALDAGNRVVGVTTYCDYPQEATQKDKIGDLYNLNMELILALEPDLVLAGRSETLQQSLAFLDDNGIPYIVVNPQSLDDIEASIKQVAKIIDSEEKGEQLVAAIQTARSSINQKVAAIAEEQRKSVFIMIDTDYLWTVGEGEFLTEMITAAGGNNAAASAGKGYVQVSEEVFFEMDPDVILCTFSMADVVLAKEAWKDLRAVKEGQVFNVNENVVSRPGPRFVEGLESIYNTLYK